MSEVLLHVTRGSVVESRHWASVAVGDAGGALLVAAGSPDRVTFWRSAAKPVQVLPLVAGGGMERFGFTGSELAVMTASHAGEDVHVQAVLSILGRLGLSEDALRCGAHLPVASAAAEALIKSGELPRAVHSNCSGKHAGMLALALLLDAPIGGYLEPEHPVQQAIFRSIAALTGVPTAVMPLGVDGCGAPTVALPLQAMATAYARLAVPSSLPASLGAAAERVSLAMRQHPHMTAGTQRFGTALMAATGGRVLAKSGAEGVVNIGLPELGLGLAIKVEDGGARGVAPLALEILFRMGVLSDEEAGSLADLHRPVVRNCAGMAVGAIEPVIPEHLSRALAELQRTS